MKNIFYLRVLAAIMALFVLQNVTDILAKNSVEPIVTETNTVVKDTNSDLATHDTDIQAAISQHDTDMMANIATHDGNMTTEHGTLSTEHSGLDTKLDEILAAVHNENGNGDTPAPVPQTRQEATFGPRDDGELMKGVVWPNPRFTDNADGTISDNLTSLIWTKDGDIFGVETWDSALDACNNLADGAGGLTDGSVAGDWRLPNIRELLSLIDYGIYDLAIPNTSGTGKWTEGDPFVNVQSTFTFYWSSTTHATFTDRAWRVSVLSGLVNHTAEKDHTQAGWVWCVR